MFFRDGPFSKAPNDRVGIPALHKRLRGLLQNITQRKFPHVKSEIYHRIVKCEDELRSLGPSRESADQQRRYLINMTVRFQEATNSALDARYRMNDFFNNSATRLATLIVAMNDQFSEKVQKHGCTVQFNSESLDLNIPPKPKSPKKHRTSKLEPLQFPTKGWRSCPESTNIPWPSAATESIEADKYPELDDVLHHFPVTEPEETDDGILN